MIRFVHLGQFVRCPISSLFGHVSLLHVATAILLTCQ